MTHNQIEYWKNVETNRHNVVTEKETERSNRAREYETNRHNVVTEGIDIGRLQETNRHNLAIEGLTQGQLDLGWANLEHNRDILSETSRHNQATESQGWSDLNIKQQQTDESIRHNVSSEGISRYSAISNAELNSSRAALLDIQSTWESLKSSANVDLTQAQITQLNNLSSKLEAELSKVQVETKNAQYEGAFIIYNEFLRGLDSMSRAVDALIPG